MVEQDHERWAELYRAYSAFYGVPAPDLDHLWRRLTAEGELECFVAELQGDVVGLAHVRAFGRPLEGDTAGFLDDLFVDPTKRGNGVGAALLDHLRSLAEERGWGVVTWITGADNHIARQLYDRVAEAQQWVTYDMTPKWLAVTPRPGPKRKKKSGRACVTKPL